MVRLGPRHTCSMTARRREEPLKRGIRGALAPALLCVGSEKGGFTAVVQPNRALSVSDHALPLRLVEEDAQSDTSQGTARVESYRRLADVFHEVLAEQSLDALLDRI